jgi:hypothetical protein
VSLGCLASPELVPNGVSRAAINPELETKPFEDLLVSCSCALEGEPTVRRAFEVVKCVKQGTADQRCAIEFFCHCGSPLKGRTDRLARSKRGKVRENLVALVPSKE